MNSKTTIRTTALLALLFALGALFATTPPHVEAQEAPPTEEQVAQPFQPTEMTIPPFVPGTVAVGLRGEMAAASALSIDAWSGVEVLAVEPLDLRTGTVSGAGTDAEPMVGYKLTVPVGTEWATIETLAARPDVLFAEPDWLAQVAQSEQERSIRETSFTVSDTLYDEQWYLQRIGMSRAWALALQASEGNLDTVRVYIIDTGIDFTHPDLTDKVEAGRSYVSGVTTVFDDNGHGTHIAGLVAAAANGEGMIGPGLPVEVTAFKGLASTGQGGIIGISQAIRDATDEGADIINLSLEIQKSSCDRPNGQDACLVLRTAVQYAVSEGVLVIAASGNSGLTSVSYPAAYPSVLAVGATSYHDVLTHYSNEGVDLDLVAPGGLTANPILSTWSSHVRAHCASGLREVDEGLYCNAEGTSMATGIVTGVAALIMALRPDLDADAVQKILLESAAPISGSSSEVGQGRLDAASALRRALPPSLIYAEGEATVSSLVGSSAFTVELPLTNPSLEPLHVEVKPTITTTWYALVGSQVGDVSYGRPLDVQLRFTPTLSATEELQSSLRVTTTSESGESSVYFISTGLNVYSSAMGTMRHFLPWADTGIETLAWAEPDFTERTTYTIDGDGSLVVDLPFTMTVNTRSYEDLRIYADGFVVASASAFPPNLPNECLSNQTWPSFAVYGWWSDLSVAADSTIATFQPTAERFVIEYNRLVSENSSDPDDRVSFQIILSRDGEIELIYGETPEHAPQSLTVGASIEDGRFYNQVTCQVAGSIRIGEAPQDHQSFVFNTEDLY